MASLTNGVKTQAARVESVVWEEGAKFLAVRRAVAANNTEETARCLDELPRKDRAHMQYLLSMAILRRNVSIVNLLLTCGYEYPEPMSDHGFHFSLDNLTLAAAMGSIPIFELMHRQTWDVNQLLAYPGPADALCTVLQQEHPSGEAVRWLLDHGAEPDGHVQRLLGAGLSPEECPGSCLEFACSKLDTLPDIIRLLLRNGAVVAGMFALHLAAKANHVAALGILIHEGGADVNATRDASDVHGVTALHVAAAWGHVECVRLLLHSGATREDRHSLGWTAKETTKRFRHPECAAMLR